MRALLLIQIPLRFFVNEQVIVVTCLNLGSNNALFAFGRMVRGLLIAAQRFLAFCKMHRQPRKEEKERRMFVA
jgi:hypothetical protein